LGYVLTHLAPLGFTLGRKLKRGSADSATRHHAAISLDFRSMFEPLPEPPPTSTTLVIVDGGR
jgi:hypothetical protein